MPIKNNILQRYLKLRADFLDKEFYKIVDLKNEPIKGYFNENEIIRVNKTEESLWYIERILKKRKIKGKQQYFVKWEGFPSAFNSWIEANQVKEK